MATIKEIIVEVSGDTSDLKSTEREIGGLGDKAAKSYFKPFKEESFSAKRTLDKAMRDASNQAREEALKSAKAQGRSMKEAYQDIRVAGERAAEQIYNEFDAEAAESAHKRLQEERRLAHQQERLADENFREQRAQQERLEREQRRSSGSVVAGPGNAKNGKKAGGLFLAGFSKAIAPLAAILGGLSIGSFLKDSVVEAGNFEQSVGAINTIFGESSKKMHKWAKDAAQVVGLNKNEYNELGALIGTQLKNSGTAMDELAPKTNKLINLGADLSSMFGGTTREAVEALSSALKGERDPIERYGVSINEASLKAHALSTGIAKATTDSSKLKDATIKMGLAQDAYAEAVKKHGKESDEATRAELALNSASRAFKKESEGKVAELSAEQKQLATLSLIYKQSSDAQGNFAKESGTLQGQQQRLNAAWTNMRITLGQKLLPVVTKLVTFLNTNLPVAIAWVKQRIQDLSPIVADVKNQFNKFLVELKAFWAKHGPEVKALLTGIAIVLGVLILASLKSTITMWRISLKLFGAFFGFLEKINTPRKFFNAFLAGLRAIGSGLYTLFIQPFVDVYNWINRLPNTMYRLGENIMQGLLNGIKSLGSSVWHGITDPIVDAYNSGKKFLGIKSPSRLFTKMGENTMLGYVKGLEAEKRGPAKALTSSLNQAATVAQNFSLPVPASMSDSEAALASSTVSYTLNVEADSDTWSEKAMKAFSELEMARQLRLA